MSENKVNYGEYMVLGVNKAMLAFLISFVLCLGISLVINHYFYTELVALTVGGLGEADNAGAGTILRTAAFILGLSTFQTTGKFQLGLLILAAIPGLAFYISGLLFHGRRQEQKKGAGMVIDGLAAAIYTIFVWLSGMVARGQLFGLMINFVSLRNLGFVLIFTIFIQFLLGGSRQHNFTILDSGLARTHSLLRLSLGFSAMTAILFILYYVTPYLKGIGKMAAFTVVALPNLAVYLCFMLMGISVDLTDSLKGLTQHLPINLSGLVLPVSIRIALIVVFIIVVLIILLRIPARKYWYNLLVFVMSFSLSSWLLAMICRINSGFGGALNISFEISLWKAFLVPLIIISLDGLLLALMRMLCREITGDNPQGIVSIFICGLEAEYQDSQRYTDTNGAADSEQFMEIQEELAAEEEPEDEEPESEIDIWKELAARPIPGSEQNLNKLAELAKDKIFHTENETKPELSKMAVEETVLPEEKPNHPSTGQQTEIIKPNEEPAKAGKEIDISLFPRKKKTNFRSLVDFSDIEDDLLVEEYEAEEILEDFTESEEVELMAEQEAEADKTRIIDKPEKPFEKWEETIPYKIHHRK
ncbi:hypothetical protein EII17_00620 [Clostridiales bacterium COT073_COT-073]|nr:hypothetical protein EII17_00620 [Clostridiales bacterium COT073_COT-073]